MGGNILNEALLVNILRKAVRGGECYSAKGRRISTLREFQVWVDTAQHAVLEGLIEASFDGPSKGKLSAGLVRNFTVLKATPVGIERLAQLSARRGIAQVRK